MEVPPQTVEFSNNSNNNNYFINSQNNFLAENSNKFVNGDRVFNQWTGKHTDSCEYKQRLNLATKPMEYYVNSLNNISGLQQNEEFLSFTPIGQANTVFVPNVYDRPIPSTLQKSNESNTIPFATSPNLGATNNINTYDTDNDLILKTGLTIRRKNNQAELAAKQWPNYGDIHAAAIGVTVQNFGQYNDNEAVNSTYNKNIPGLDVTPSHFYNQRIQDPSRQFVSSTVLQQNYFQGPIKQSCHK